ncbi:MAG: hypothetical protein U1A77_10840 [Pirellulales bacterium]
MAGVNDSELLAALRVCSGKKKEVRDIQTQASSVLDLAMAWMLKTRGSHPQEDIVSRPPSVASPLFDKVGLLVVFSSGCPTLPLHNFN